MTVSSTILLPCVAARAHVVPLLRGNDVLGLTASGAGLNAYFGNVYFSV